MTLLIDTHLLLWSATASPVMPQTGAEIIQSWPGRRICSAAAVWEVGIKFANRRGAPNDMPMSAAELMDVLHEADVDFLPISPAHCVAVARLPFHHRDPFDRIMVAQAQVEGLTFLTTDSALAAYGDRVRVI